MEKKKLQKKEIIIIALACVLFIPITYALFKTMLFGNGTVILAKWDVSLNQQNVNNNLSIIPAPNETVASYTVNITSVSDVSVEYSIIVDNLPSGVSVDLDGDGYVSESNNKVVFSDVDTIPYNDSTKTRTHTLTFKAASNATYVNNNEVDISVKVKQKINSGGS